MEEDHDEFLEKHGEKANLLWFFCPEREAAAFLVHPVDLAMVHKIMESIHTNPRAITKPFFCSGNLQQRYVTQLIVF